LWESRNTIFETSKRKFTQAFGRISIDELKIEEEIQETY
jgi:hypothetical protein